MAKYEEYRKLDEEQTADMIKVGFEIIPLDKVRQNTYILVGSRYRVSKTVSKFEVVSFCDIATLTRGVNYQKKQQTTYRTSNIILPADNISLSGELTIEKEIFVDETVTLSDDKKLKRDDIFICMSSGSKEHIGKVAFVDQDTNYYAGGFMGIIRTNPQRCLSKYLYFYLLASERYREEIKLLTQGANINNISSTINSISIPLPPIDVQQQIVSELESNRQIIAGARTVVQNYKPVIAINENWERTTVGNLFEVVADTINPVNETGNTIYIGLENIEAHTGKIIGQLECDITTIKSAKRVFRSTDILYGKLRPALNKVAFPNTKGICSTDIIVLRAKENDILPAFYSVLLRDDEFNQQVLNGVSGGQLPRLDVKYLLDLPIYRVPISEQTEILDKINSEKDLTQSTEKLIKMFSIKIQEKIRKVWGE